MRYTQFGEDKMINEIFELIGTTNKIFVDIGAGCRWSNVEFLEEQGWTGLKLDREYGDNITAENVEVFLRDLTDNFDFLTIDIDGNDYWIWKAIKKNPRVVCIEYESRANGEWIQEYDPAHEWDNHSKVGASRDSIMKLAEEKGYRFYGETGEANLFFIKI